MTGVCRGESVRGSEKEEAEEEVVVWGAGCGMGIYIKKNAQH